MIWHQRSAPLVRYPSTRQSPRFGNGSFNWGPTGEDFSAIPFLKRYWAMRSVGRNRSLNFETWKWVVSFQDPSMSQRASSNTIFGSPPLNLENPLFWRTGGLSY